MLRSNNVDAGREIAEHLYELGHRRIAYLGGPEDSLDSRQRAQGLEEGLALRRLKIAPQFLIFAPNVNPTLAFIASSDGESLLCPLNLLCALWQAGQSPKAANQHAKAPLPPISPNSLKPRKLVTPSDRYAPAAATAPSQVPRRQSSAAWVSAGSMASP